MGIDADAVNPQLLHVLPVPQSAKSGFAVGRDFEHAAIALDRA